MSREASLRGPGCLLDFNRIGERFLGTLRPARPGRLDDQPGRRFVAHYETELVGQNAFSARRDRNPGFSYERIDRIMREEMLKGNTGWMNMSLSGIGKKKRHPEINRYARSGRLGKSIRRGGGSLFGCNRSRLGKLQRLLWLLAIMAGTLLAGTYVGQKINQQRVLAEEKVQWSEAIVKSQTRLQALFDGAPDAIILVDPDYRISTVNKTGLDWYGRPWRILSASRATRCFRGWPSSVRTARRRNLSPPAGPLSARGRA